MEQQQISAKKLKAMEKVKRANAELAKVVREEKEQTRKAQDRHKYMMGRLCGEILPRSLGKTTYVASLHFKEQGDAFSRKLKRAVKAALFDCYKYLSISVTFAQIWMGNIVNCK